MKLEIDINEKELIEHIAKQIVNKWENKIEQAFKEKYTNFLQVFDDSISSMKKDEFQNFDLKKEYMNIASRFYKSIIEISKIAKDK